MHYISVSLSPVISDDINGWLHDFDVIIVTNRQGCLDQLKILKNGCV